MHTWRVEFVDMETLEVVKASSVSNMKVIPRVGEGVFLPPGLFYVVTKISYDYLRKTSTVITIGIEEC